MSQAVTADARFGLDRIPQPIQLLRMEDSDAVADVVLGMRRRARAARLTSYGLIGVLVIVGIASAFLFLAVTRSISTVTIGDQVQLEGDIRIGGDLEWLQELTQAFVRVGAVLMALFIINILVSFSRYSLKLANSLDARADCLVLAADNRERLASLLATISVDVIDFMSVPARPYDRYLDTLRALFPGDRSTDDKEEPDPTESRNRSVRKEAQSPLDAPLL